MFEDRIAALNKDTEAMPSIPYILGIGRNSAYNLVKSGVFHSVRIGGNIRISKKSFDEWLDKQMDTCQV